MAVASYPVLLKVERGRPGSLAYPWTVNFFRQQDGVAIDVSTGYTYSCRFTDSQGVTFTAGSVSYALAGLPNGEISPTFSDAQVQTFALGVGAGQLDEIVAAVVVNTILFTANIVAAS